MERGIKKEQKRKVGEKGRKNGEKKNTRKIHKKGENVNR